MNSFQISPSPRRGRLYRLPLVPAAAALAGGILAGRYAPLPVGFWVVLGLGSLVAATILLLRPRLRPAAGAAAVAVLFCTGAAYLRMEYFSIPDDHMVTYTGHGAILATVRGRVVTFPCIDPSRPAPTSGYDPGPRTSFLLEADAVEADQDRCRDWRPASGLVQVTVRQADRRLKAGVKVKLVGWLGRFRPPDNPGQFDFAAASRNRRTLVRMSVPAIDGVTILGPAQLPWYRQLIWRAKAAARQHLLACGGAPSGHLLNALITGERHPTLRALNRTMVRVGVAHFLSISGLHLGVFLGFVYFLCRVVARTPRTAALVVLVALGLYVLLAEPRAPLLRSAIMAAALCAAVISQRRYTALNALAAAGICLLVVDPIQLFAPGFQLSFAIVAGLILLHRPVRGLLFGRWLRRRGLIVFRGEARLQRWLYYRAANFLMDAVTICLTAYLVSAPLVAYHFGLFTPYAALSSLLLLPFVTVVLVPGYVSMALAGPMPNLSYGIGRLAGAAADLMCDAVGWMGTLPGASLELRPLGPLWVLACYATLAVAVLCRRLRHGRVWAVTAILLLAGATVYSQRGTPAPPTAEMHLLAVGEGQCALLRTPAGRTFLLDAGTRGHLNAHQDVLKPFLRATGLPEPRVALVSHANTDHFNALLRLLRQRRLDRAYLGDYFGRNLPGREAQPEDQELLRLLASRNVKVVRIRAPDKVDLDEQTQLEVLWPEARENTKLTANDTSLVLRVTCDGQSILLTGDIGALPQSALVRTENIAAEVLVLPHHGGWEPTLPAFVGAVRPKILLVSGRDRLGETALMDAQRAAFYDALSRKYEYYCTGRDGWICVRFGAGGISVQTMR